MKRLISSAALAFITMLMLNCKKPKSVPVNTAHCNTCSGTVLAHTFDADSVCYLLPTAFTPNGDGINDIYWMMFDHIVADSSSVTIWDMSGDQVFDKTLTGFTAGGWDARDLSGNRCALGSYPVHVVLKTNKGATVDVCTCVTILGYTGSCIKTMGTTYYFPDQMTPDSGFHYPTNDLLCP